MPGITEVKPGNSSYCIVLYDAPSLEEFGLNQTLLKESAAGASI